ncbi:MAG: tetratricopeptide repeat protein [Hormoscilla sp.]
MTDKLIGGHYRLVKQWRDNNSCQTHLAEDTHLQGKYCVVKKLQLEEPALSSNQIYRNLFDREVQTLYALGEHPQIPELKAHFNEDEVVYLVQELIEGEDLSKSEIPHQQWTESQVIDFLVDVLDILVFVHDRNVIHRDIKPSNLIRRKSDGKIVLIDFGAVKHIATNIQNYGTIVGTPGYMPPEQHIGQPQFSSDIYALGMTAIAALTGVGPNHLDRDAEREVVWRDRASVSPGLADILDKMVRNNCNQRYQTAREVLDDLQKLKQQPPPSDPLPNGSSSPFPWKKYVGVAIAVAALLGVSLSLIISRVNRAAEAIAHYNEANQLIDREKYEEAIAAFDAALEIQSDFAEAWADRGYALGQLGQQQDKFSSCDRAILLEPHLTEAWNCRGLARHSLEQYEEAIKDYEEALTTNPNFSAAWYNKGETLLQIQQHRKALRSLNEAIDIDPDYLFAWNLKCKAHYELEEYSEALAACEQALEIDPNYEPAKQRLTWVRQKLDK